MMQLNLIRDTAQRVNEMAPYVDRIVVVDSGSVDDSILYLRNHEAVDLYVHAWADCWPKQRNFYLQHANEDPKADWIVVLDSDSISTFSTVYSGSKISSASGLS